MTVLGLTVPRDADLAARLGAAPWRRLVAVGDSIAAGVREPAAGWPDRSWIDWIAAALPRAEVHNLGRRNLLAAEVRERQLDAALALRPDLAIVSAGGNDSLRPSFDTRGVTAELDAIVGALRAAGADVLLLELMDITRAPGVIPAEHREALRARLRAVGAVTRTVAERHDAFLLSMTEHPACADPTVYARDRLHLTTRGHAIVGVEAVGVLAAAAARRAVA